MEVGKTVSPPVRIVGLEKMKRAWFLNITDPGMGDSMTRIHELDNR